MGGGKFDCIRNLIQTNKTKIVLFVLDGLGGLPREPGGPTELEAASTPNMDALAAEGITGLHVPVGAGITPGSGAGHLGILGYDPLKYTIGRGALAAAGIDFDLRPGDVAARGNFCTVDEDGKVINRRAGRIDTDENKRLCKMLREIRIDDVDIFVETIKEHRFLLVLRGEALSDAVAETDPQATQINPLEPMPLVPEAEATAGYVKRFVRGARKVLQAESRANMIILRGFAAKPEWPLFGEVFGLSAAAVAAYPMYRGLARILGMDVFEYQNGIHESVALVRDLFYDFDFFFVHLKPIDSSGEDGDFDAKVRAIEESDAQALALRELDPDVLIVTGDHSTPARLSSHSWHPVPVLLWSKTCRADSVTAFGETNCLDGALGPRFQSTDLMPLALAHAGRLKKYGA